MPAGLCAIFDKPEPSANADAFRHFSTRLLTLFRCHYYDLFAMLFHSLMSHLTACPTFSIHFDSHFIDCIYMSLYFQSIYFRR